MAARTSARSQHGAAAHQKDNRWLRVMQAQAVRRAQQRNIALAVGAAAVVSLGVGSVVPLMVAGAALAYAAHHQAQVERATATQRSRPRPGGRAPRSRPAAARNRLVRAESSRLVVVPPSGPRRSPRSAPRAIPSAVTSSASLVAQVLRS